VTGHPAAVTGHPAAMPLTLPSVGRRQARRDGWLAMPRDPFRLPLGEGALILQPAAVEPRPTGPLLRIDAIVAGRAASLWCPRELVDALLRDSFALAPADADPALLPLLVEEAATPLLAALERASGLSLALTAVTSVDAVPDGVAAAFMLTAPGWPATKVWLACTTAVTLRLDAALHARPLHPQPWRDLSASLALRVGVATLARAEIAGLAPGDAVLLDVWTGAFGKAIAIVTETAGQTCTASPGGFVLDGPLQPRRGRAALTPARPPQPHTWEAFMSDIDTAPLPLDGALRDVQIRLVFELGRLDLPLASLESLGAGHVFELGRGEDEPVDIIVGSRRIGTGQLVRIADQVGVRIVSLAR